MSLLTDNIPSIDIQSICYGKWNVEIVNPERDNASYFPLGEEMKPNLLTQIFYDLFGAQLPFTKASSIITTSSAPPVRAFPEFIGSATAVIGNGITPPVLSDYKLENVTKSSSYVKPNFQLCGFTDNYTTGSRTFFKAWDFASNTGSSETYTEGGIQTDWRVYRGILGNVNGKTDGYGRFELFSRFLFSAPVVVPRGSFLRLRYELTVTIPAIISPIPVSVQYQNTNLTGGMSLIGSWQSIFGRITSNGVPQYNASEGYGYAPFIPPSSYVNGSYNTDGYSGGLCPEAILVAPNIVRPSIIGNFLNLTYVLGTIVYIDFSKLVHKTIYGKGASTMPYGQISFVSSSGTYNSSVCRYLFFAPSPLADAEMGGIIFGIGPFSGMSAPESYLLNNATGSYWYLKFNRRQKRIATEYLMFDLRHTIVSG